MGFSFGFGATLFLLNAGCAGAGNPESKIARQEGRELFCRRKSSCALSYTLLAFVDGVVDILQEFLVVLTVICVVWGS